MGHPPGRPPGRHLRGWIVEYHRIANPQPEIHALCKSLFEDAGFTVRLATKTEDNGLLWAWKA